MFAFARIYVVCAVWCLLYCHYPFFSNSRFVCVRQVYLCLCLRSRLLSFAVRFCLPAILPLLLFTFVPSSLWAQVSWVELICSWATAQQAATMCFNSFSPIFSLSRFLSGKGGKWCRCCGFVIPCSAVTVRIWSNGSRMWNKMNSCTTQPHTHIKVRARVKKRSRALHKRAYTYKIYKCDSLSNHLLHSLLSFTLSFRCSSSRCAFFQSGHHRHWNDTSEVFPVIFSVFIVLCIRVASKSTCSKLCRSTNKHTLKWHLHP